MRCRIWSADFYSTPWTAWAERGRFNSTDCGSVQSGDGDGDGDGVQFGFVEQRKNGAANSLYERGCYQGPKIVLFPG